MSLINDALKRASQAQRSQRAPRIPDEILKPVEEGVQPAIPPPPPQPKRLSPAFWRAFLAIGLFGSSTLVMLEWWLIQQEAQELMVAKGKHRPGARMGTVAPGTNAPVPTITVGTPPKPPEPTAVTNGTVIVIGDNPPPKVTPPPVATTNGAAPPRPGPETVAKTPDPLPPQPPTGEFTSVNLSPPTNSIPPTPFVTPKQTNAGPAVVEIQRPFPRLKLQGIFYSTKKPLALINNQHLGIGDTIEEARVVRIEKSSVVFEFFGRTNEVWLLR